MPTISPFGKTAVVSPAAVIPVEDMTSADGDTVSNGTAGRPYKPLPPLPGSMKGRKGSATAEAIAAAAGISTPMGAASNTNSVRDSSTPATSGDTTAAVAATSPPTTSVAAVKTPPSATSAIAPDYVPTAKPVPPWVADMPRLDGKLTVVTGASSAMGRETARFLAHLGATVVMACRDPVKAIAAKDRILIESPGIFERQLVIMELDMGNLASIRTFVQRLNESGLANIPVTTTTYIERTSSGTGGITGSGTGGVDNRSAWSSRNNSWSSDVVSGSGSGSGTGNANTSVWKESSSQQQSEVVQQTDDKPPTLPIMDKTASKLMTIDLEDLSQIWNSDSGDFSLSSAAAAAAAAGATTTSAAAGAGTGAATGGKPTAPGGVSSSTAGQRAANRLRSISGSRSNPGNRQSILAGYRAHPDSNPPVLGKVSYNQEWARPPRGVSVLVNHESVVGSPKDMPGLTVDGFEYHFGVDYLGPWLLTNLMAPLLKMGVPARVINVTNGSHRLSRNPTFADIRSKSHLLGLKQYTLSKACVVSFTRESARRLASSGVYVYAANPGMAATGWTTNYWKPVKKMLQGILKNESDAVHTTLFLATKPGIENLSGYYFSDCRVAQVHGYCSHPENDGDLWEKTISWVGMDRHESV